MVRVGGRQPSFLDSIGAPSALALGRGLIEEREDPRGGTWDSDDTMNARIWKILGLENTIDSTVLKNAIRVGLRYFPLSGKGIIFSPEKAIELLEGVRDTGFPLDPYHTLNPEELWGYVNDTKAALRKLGDSRCPHVLRDVNAEHAEAYLNH